MKLPTPLPDWNPNTTCDICKKTIERKREAVLEARPEKSVGEYGFRWLHPKCYFKETNSRST